ncbi:MAG: hypothetical protein QM831_46220 [Kofleriaceae bacterium]
MMRPATSGLVIALAGAMSFVIACSFGGSQDHTNDPQPDAATAAHCGDGVCAASEVSTCPADCGGGSNQGSGSNTSAVCGNGTCENGENSTNCAADCGTGSGSGSGTCDSNTAIECAFCLAADPTGAACTALGLDPTMCMACSSGFGSGFGDLGCDGGAADGTCESDESNATCPSDCP